MSFESAKAGMSASKGADAGFTEMLGLLKSGDKKVRVQLYSLLNVILDKAGDKDKKTADAATTLALELTRQTEAWAAAALFSQKNQFVSALTAKSKPGSKECALEMVCIFANLGGKDPAYPDLEDKWYLASPYKIALGREIDVIVNDVCLLCNDIKKTVAAKAKQALEDLCYCCSNKDILGSLPHEVVVAPSFVPTIIKSFEGTKNVEDCVEKLAGCVFVQNVEAPHLSVISPVLVRGLNHKSEAVQRRCLVIIDNMCKLVDDEREGCPLIPTVLPLVRKRVEEISDPDAREMAEKTLKTMLKMQQAGVKPEIMVKDVCVAVDPMIYGNLPDGADEYLQTSCYAMSKVPLTDGQHRLQPETWKTIMKGLLPDNAADVVIKKMTLSGAVEEVEFIDHDSENPDLYKGGFSLAYGTLTLLRDAKMHLKKNKFYGLLGPNNCGKTTLMREIAREKLEGFPKRDELVTIFVEHEVEEREIAQEDGRTGKTDKWPLGKFNIDLNGVEFCVDTCNNIYNRMPPVTFEEAEAELGLIGFKNKAKKVNVNAAADMMAPITTYSGGWKVKMQLCCAKLINADILMLDEPTGHLDVKNIAWMKNWLNNFPGSIIASSSNSQFLDEMCTHIIDFQDRKLIQFPNAGKGEKADRGNVLSNFVKCYPEKKAYFELSNRAYKMVFPAPGVLEGVKSRGRAILKMNNVSFKYPNHEKNTVQDICLSVCMASRIAVVGPNGAGKSTAIKLLIGELKNETGTIFRHSGMRLAYVAQHAFHHLEKHLDKTPVQYILWRFAGNDDRESLENQTKELNVDEEALRQVKWCVDGKSGTVRKVVIGEKSDIPVTPDCILNRRKNKQKKYEYETKWMFKPIESAVWVERETMIAMGYEKMVQRQDEKEAAAAGLLSKPLTAPGAEKALKDFGLDNESASHSPINSLSGGQKVKVVLAAAMWQNPHVLILDEPTNYLDRDGLGALSLGLKEYLGGVVIISHNMEFAESVCSQKWIMEAGRLREEGEVAIDEDAEEALKKAAEGADEVTDAQGNVIKVNKEKTMSDKDKKKTIKDIEKRLKDHKKKNTLSDADKWELEDKLELLKSEMAA